MIEFVPIFGFMVLVFCLYYQLNLFLFRWQTKHLDALKEIRDELKQMNTEFAIQRRYDRELEDDK